MNNNNIHVLSRGVIIDANNILLAYDPRPHPNHYYQLNTLFYYLPGGHIDFRESGQNALIREIKEETGLAATIEKFLGVIEHSWSFPGDEICCHTHEINLIFKLNIAKLKYGDVVPQKEEHVAFKWIEVDHLKIIDLRPLPLKFVLSKWLERADDNIFLSTMK